MVEGSVCISLKYLSSVNAHHCIVLSVDGCVGFQVMYAKPPVSVLRAIADVSYVRVVGIGVRLGDAWESWRIVSLARLDESMAWAVVGKANNAPTKRRDAASKNVLLIRYPCLTWMLPSLKHAVTHGPYYAHLLPIRCR